MAMLRRNLLASLTLLGTIVAPRAASAQTVDPHYFAGMRWRSIGPNRSGYVAAVAGIPGDPTTYYVGLPEGGVWKTTNGGVTWRPIFDSVHVASVGAVAVAPSSPDVVYVGTGNQSGWSFTPGNGVYKSTDAGATWTNVGLTHSGYIASIVVDPRNPDRVLVAALGGPGAAATGGEADRGVYRTTDGGRNWTRVLGGELGAGELNADFDAPEFVYATLGGGRGGGPAAATNAAGIYRSTDGGATWQAIGGQGLPEGPRAFPLTVASGTRGQRLYAEVRGGRGSTTPGGIFRSDDGGDTWTLGTSEIASAGGHIYADPQHPDVIYLMGTSMYRSTDGGRHFAAYMGAPSGDDIRQLWIDPTNSRRMLIGADQGPTISVDGGASWSLWNNMQNGQFYRVSTDSDFPYHVCGPQQDSGTACVLSRSDFGMIRPNDWTPVAGFENGFIATDPRDSRWVYTQGWYHVLRRFDRTTGQVVVLYTPAPGDRFNTAPPLMFSPQNPSALYLASQYLMTSTDAGRSWRRISPDLTAGSRPAAAPPAGRGGLAGATIQALSPSTRLAGEIWAGTSNGLVQLTRDGGKSWSNVTPPDLPPGAINIIDASHHAPGTAYFALLSRDNLPHLYRTTDFGHSWREITSGIAADGVARVIREDPADAALLYAGTVTAAYVSFDRGDHWQSLQLNLPTTVVSDMTVHGNDLVISTYGRGFWILDDVTPLRQARDAMAATTPAFLYQPGAASRARWDNTQDTPLNPEVPAGKNPPEGAIVDYYLAAPASGPITMSFWDSTGQLVRQYSDVAPPRDTLMPNVPDYWFAPPTVLDRTPGMHRINWDLRYPDPSILPYGYTGNLLNYVEYTLNWHAIPGETPRATQTGPMVVPGSYTVKLTVNGTTLTRRLTVIQDPRISVPQASLEAQLRLELRMMAGLDNSDVAWHDVATQRAALSAALTATSHAPQGAAIAAAAAPIEQHLASIAQAGLGTANRDLARQLADMAIGDVAPTASVLAATAVTCSRLDSALADLARVRATAFGGLNKLLAEAGAQQIPARSNARAGCATSAAGRPATLRPTLPPR